MRNTYYNFRLVKIQIYILGNRLQLQTRHSIQCDDKTVSNTIMNDSCHQKRNTKLLQRCAKCNTTFRTYEGLMYHMQKVCITPVLLYKCTKCRQVVKTRRSLWKHVNFCGKEPNLCCLYCPFKTKYKRNLSNHLYNIHQKMSNIDKSLSNEVEIESMYTYGTIYFIDCIFLG